MTELSGFLNLVIAAGCLAVLFACVLKAETPFLRVAIGFVLSLEVIERTLIGTARLADSNGEAVQEVLVFANPVRVFLALSVFALAWAVMRLERPGDEEPRNEDDP